jgi:hypothetical protein
MAIRGNQRQSEAIRGNQCAHEMQSMAISDPHAQSP